MRHAFVLAALVLTIASVSAFAEDSIVGKWEGKDKDGKVHAIEFKADHTMVATEDGKNGMPEGASVKWEVVDAEKGHINITMTMKDADGKEESHKLEAVFELKGDSLKLGSPSEVGKRAESLDKSEEILELTRKK